jgi:acyl-coenzyme A thioesterase PaaI-like protein
MPAPRTALNPIRSLWDRLAPLPGGKRLFSVLIGRKAPYSGTISPRVEELGPGFARVVMHDRRGVRNHLRSIHAVALMNLAELASGLALNYALPDDARAILTNLSIEYLKKARGTLTAQAEVEVPRSNEERSYLMESLIRDGAGDLVARATAQWLVGPRAR